VCDTHAQRERERERTDEIEETYRVIHGSNSIEQALPICDLCLRHILRAHQLQAPYKTYKKIGAEEKLSNK
jgi:hypothetical protein